MTEELQRHATNYGAGKVHLARRPKLKGGYYASYAVLYCTGRAMSSTVATGQPVDCKACLKRAKREGVEA